MTPPLHNAADENGTAEDHEQPRDALVDELVAAARKALDFIQSLPYEPSIARSTKAQDALVDVLAKVECR